MIQERDFYRLLGGFIAGEIEKQLAPVRHALGEVNKAIKGLGDCADQDSETFDALTQRIEKLEKVLGDMPVPVDGKDGAPGKDVDMGAVNEMIQSAAERCVDFRLATWPKPKDGIDGKDGKDGKDGINGTNGADGESVRLDDVRDWLGALVRQTVDDLPIPRHCVGGFIDRGGALLLSFSDGSTSNLGPVVGKDGKDCDMAAVAEQVSKHLAGIEKPKDGKDGKDGLGFKDMSVTFDGERSFIFRFVLEDRTEELSLRIPFMIYRGVWKAGGYERGDVVTRDGGSFVALADTLTIPGTKDCEWQLCCKRGGEGPRGKEGPQGPAGPMGGGFVDPPATAWPLKGA